MSKTEWFDRWFDTPFYHILYQHRDYKEAEIFISNLVESLDIPKDNSILDVACGKGRHAIFLNSLGYNVTGIDLSAESIREAKKNENDRLKFSVHDMRVPYADGNYDYVFNLFTSFGYFDKEDENLRSIEAMSKALKTDGTLILDFFNSPVVKKNLVPSEQKTIDGIKFNITRTVTNGWIIKKITFEFETKNYEFQERVKAIDQKDFLHYFEHAGLAVTDVYGDYSLNEYVKEESPRLILIAKKK